MGNEFRRRIVTADDQDAHTRWRHRLVYCTRAGETARMKRATNRRERREGRAEIVTERPER